MPLSFEEMQQLLGEQGRGGRMSFEDLRKATKEPQARQVEAEPPDLFDSLLARIQGTDVDDPAPLTRMIPTAVGAIAGAAAGIRAAATPAVISALSGTVAGVRIGLTAAPATGPAAPVVVFGAALLGGAVGAVTGAVSPEFTVEIAEALGFAEPGTRERTLLSNEDLLIVAKGEGLLDLAFGGAMQTVGLLGRGAGKLVTGVGKKERALAERAATAGITLTPAMLQTTAWSRFFVPVFGRFPFIGGPLRRSGRLADKQIKEIVLELPGIAGKHGGVLAKVIAETDIGMNIFRNARTWVKKINRDFSKKYEAFWTRADEAGVVATPKALLREADDIVAQIEKAVPPKLVKGKVVKGDPGEATSIVHDFIAKKIMPLRARAADATVTLSLSLREMDGLLTQMDEALSAVEPAQRKFVMKLFKRLEIAAQKDIVVNLRGPGAEVLGAELRALDREFSDVVRFMFETPAAKRFAAVRKRGLRGITADEATKVPVDRVYKAVVDLESPQIMDQLSRLVSKKTYRQIVVRALDDELSKGLKFDQAAGQTIFNPEPVLTSLGALRRSPAKLTTMDLMLRKAGGLRMADVETVLEAARGLARSAIPDMNAFIARRGTLGGAEAIMKGLLPGVAIVGSGVAGGADRGTPILGGIFGMMVFIGGGNAMARLMVNPRTALPLRVIASKTASVANRRASYLRLVRVAGAMLKEDAVFPEAWADGMVRAMESTVKYWMSFEDAAVRTGRRVIKAVGEMLPTAP